jgi:Abnormal spindle-like microcephaly-assoc'd, ASPM-SPD-2-Hydin
MTRTRLPFAAVGALLALALAGGVAYATIAGSDTLYTACVLKGVGQMRLIDKSLPSTSPGSRCTDKETEISWNQAGQPGEKGDKGDPGNLALAEQSCPDGAFVTGFDQNGDLVCAAPGGGNGGGGGGGGEPGEILVSPPQLDFASTPVGAAADAVLTLTNTGTVDVAVPIIITGENLADFSVTDGCLAVPAQGTCNLTVRFAPLGSGTRRALMTIQRPNNESVLVPLSGTGAATAHD